MSDILTDNGQDFCGKVSHPYELYLELNDIELQRTKVRHSQTNGFVEYFQRTVLDEFFRKAFRIKFFESVETLQCDLNKWLVYRNQGKRPKDWLEEYIQQKQPLAFFTVDESDSARYYSSQSRAFSEAAFDRGEHLATLDPGDVEEDRNSEEGK